MKSTAAPSREQITTFLRGLREYRGTLDGPSQLLLDTMVTAALTRTPDQPLPPAVHPLWSAYAGSPLIWSGLDRADGTHGWAASPWGAVYGGDHQG
jgi:hypothetical protein